MSDAEQITCRDTVTDSGLRIAPEFCSVFTAYHQDPRFTNQRDSQVRAARKFPLKTLSRSTFYTHILRRSLPVTASTSAAFGLSKAKTQSTMAPVPNGNAKSTKMHSKVVRTVFCIHLFYLGIDRLGTSFRSSLAQVPQGIRLRSTSLEQTLTQSFSKDSWQMDLQRVAN